MTIILTSPCVYKRERERGDRENREKGRQGEEREDREKRGGRNIWQREGGTRELIKQRKGKREGRGKDKTQSKQEERQKSISETLSTIGRRKRSDEREEENAQSK